MIKKLGGLFGRNPTFKNVTIEGVLNTIFGTVSSGASLTADTDTSLTANSDSKVATQKAIKTYVDGLVTGLLDFKGGINCSTNPNYPAALKGDAYVVTAAGKIGGASGVVVAVGDMIVASADNAGGTQAAVGTSWFALEKNLDGALLSANNLSDLANASTARTNLGLGSAATTASTDYAVAAKGVTNGDSHDHNGGDGAQIAYSSLSGLPTLGTMASQAANSVAITGGAISGASLQGVTPTGAAGSGKLVFDTSPTLTTPTFSGDTTVTGGEAYLGIQATAAGGKKWYLISGGGGNVSPGYLTLWNAAGGNKVMSIAPSTSEQFVTDLNGNFQLVSGNLVIGASGKGNNFTANIPAAGMSSQLFNWYEEGNWVPTVASSGGGTPTYVRQIGYYTRIGNRVFFQIEIDLASKGTLAAGNLSLTGLPYISNSTVANWASANAGICDGFTYPAGANQLTAVVGYNSTTVSLYWIKSGASTINTVIADISSTARINFSGHYMI